jgi:hypothetical protein
MMRHGEPIAGDTASLRIAEVFTSLELDVGVSMAQSLPAIAATAVKCNPSVVTDTERIPTTTSLCVSAGLMKGFTLNRFVGVDGVVNWTALLR